MPKVYDKLGLRFQYPDNWTLDEEEVRQSRAVTVYSPGGGFWSATAHPRNADRAQLADAALEAMREEYQDLESEEVEEIVAGKRLIGHDINFCYLDLTSTATVRCVELDSAMLVIFCEAEDREFEELKQVFAAMTYSLLTGR